MSIRDDIYSESCPFGIVPIRDGPHSGWCPFGMMYIQDGVHSGWCPFGMMSIRDGVHSRWFPFAMVSIRDGVHSGWCPFGIVSIRDGVQDPDRVIEDKSLRWSLIEVRRRSFTLRTASMKKVCSSMSEEVRRLLSIVLPSAFLNDSTIISYSTLAGSIRENPNPVDI